LDPSTAAPIGSLGLIQVGFDPSGITQKEIAINTPAPLIAAIQLDLAGNKSAMSEAFQVEDPASRTSGGSLPPTIFACGRATNSTGHQAGDALDLFGTDSSGQVYRRFYLGSALSSDDYLPIGAFTFREGEYVNLVTLYCNGSNSQYSTVVKKFPSRLPKPRLLDATLVPGATSFLAGNIITGARLTVELSRNGSLTTWTEDCGSGTCPVFMPTPLGFLEPGDHVTVRQVLCDGSTSADGHADVAICDSITPPDVVTLPRFGDTSTAVRSTTIGALNVVLVTDSLNSRVGLRVLGIAPSAGVVGFSRPLAPPDVWMVVTQPTASCPSPIGSDFGIVP